MQLSLKSIESRVAAYIPEYYRQEVIVGLGGCAALGAIMLLFPSAITLSAILVVILGLITVWVGYEYLPLALLLLLPFSLEVPISGKTNITLPTEVFIPFLMLLFVGESLMKGKIRYWPSSLNLYVIAFYLLTVVSILYTQHPIPTLKALVRDTGYLLAGYYLIPRFITSDKRLIQLLIGALIMHTLLVFYGFATQVIGGIKIYDDNIAAPFFVEHCIYAAYITISLSFVIAYFLDMDEGLWRMIVGAVGAIMAIAVALTFVRAAWMSIVFMLFFYLLMFSKRRSGIDLVIIMIFGFMGASGVILSTDLGEMIIKRVETIADFNYVANYDRLDRWIAAWDMWKDHPWLGVGWGGYPDEYFDYVGLKKAFSSGDRMGAHNLYLELLAELGVVGLTLYLTMIYVFFYKTFKLLSRVTRLQRTFIIGMQGMMITYLAHAFLNNLGPSDKIGITFWFCLGMVPCMEALAREKEMVNQPVPQEPERRKPLPG